MKKWFILVLSLLLSTNLYASNFQGPSGGVTDHGALTGLSNDDHEYVLNTGDTMTGLLDLNVAGTALDVQNTTDAVSNTVAIFRGGDRTTAVNNDTALIKYFMENAAGTQIEIARVFYRIDDVVAGDENSTYQIQLLDDGVLKTAFIVSSVQAGKITNVNPSQLNMIFRVAGDNDGELITTNALADTVTFGTGLALAKVAVDGDADEIQFLVQGNVTQTTDLLVLEQSDGTDVYNVSNSGQTTVGGMLIQNTATIAVDDTTPDVSSGNIFTTSANTVGTAITDLDLPQVGQIVYIIGGSDTNASTIADSGNFNLSAAFTANLDDVLVLFVQGDNDYVELSRSNN